MASEASLTPLAPEDSLPQTDERLDPGVERADAFRTAFVEWHQDSQHARRWFVGVLLGLVVGEVVFSGAVLWSLGRGYLHLQEWVAGPFFVSVLAQVVALVHVVLRHLFPTPPFSLAEQYRQLPVGDDRAV